jgi:type II secretory ATPase GspE/PulE/Tfp pilus assembly ATPase PilB-like protein
MTWADPAKEDIEEFGWQDVADPQVPIARGCSFCCHTGYAGRLGLYEMIPVDRGVREMIRRDASQDEISAAVFEQRRLPTLAIDGAEKVLQGLTTVEEVRRVTYLGRDS